MSFFQVTIIIGSIFSIKFFDWGCTNNFFSFFSQLVCLFVYKVNFCLSQFYWKMLFINIGQFRTDYLFISTNIPSHSESNIAFLESKTIQMWQMWNVLVETGKLNMQWNLPMIIEMESSVILNWIKCHYLCLQLFLAAWLLLVSR